MVQRNMRHYFRLGHRKVEIQLTSTITHLPIPPPTTSAQTALLCSRTQQKYFDASFFFLKKKKKINDKANGGLGQADEAKEKGLMKDTWLEILCCLPLQHKLTISLLFSDSTVHSNCFTISIYFLKQRFFFLVIPKITFTHERNI